MARSAGPRKPTAKQVQKQAAKDKKQRERNEATFNVAVQNSKSTILDVDMRFIQDTLNQNPLWISPLAGLIRSGSLNGLLKEVATKDTLAGLRWKGRCTKLAQLPLDMCLLMLQATGVELSEDIAQDESFVRALFAGQFWVSAQTPLPNRPDIRSQTTLEKLARTRIKETLKRNWAAALNSQESLGNSRETLQLWSLEGNSLKNHCFALGDRNELSQDFKAGGECDLEHVLPHLPDGQEWRLSDPFAPDCIVSDGQTSSVFRFECASFFPMFPKCADKWTSDLPTDADTIAPDAGQQVSRRSSAQSA